MEASVTFDKFKVVRKLGRGGMGTVYEGYDPGLDRRVAIKTLTSEAISDQECRSRFEREARAAAKLQHPNIVTIYELGNFGSKERPYIVMEYLEGADLSTLVTGDTNLPLSEALAVTVQLCRALDFAHQHGIVHRDVKPSNIRYLDDGQVKIMDFGIARIEGGDQITRSGFMVGTPHYMSPEQIKGDKIDGRSDVFSSGCILYEMLAGKRPFRGETATSILYKIVNEAPPPLLKANPELPQEVETILNRALAKSPKDRFQTAGEMAGEIEKLLQIHRKSFPRISSDLQNRLREMERLGREKKWADVVTVAQKLVEERPELEVPQRTLRKAYRELRRERDEHKVTPEGRTRHLAEISHELTQLYGQALQPTAVESPPTIPGEEPTAGELKLRTKTAVAEGGASSHLLLKMTATLFIVVGLVLAGWFVLPGLVGTQEVSHTVQVFSNAPGSSIFINGKDRGVVTDENGKVEVLVKGREGDMLSIELRHVGYESATTALTFGAEPPPPVDLSLEPILTKYEVRTDPPGAQVVFDGRELAQETPLELEISATTEHELVISKEGYTSKTLKIALGEELPSEEIVLARIQKPGTLMVQSLYSVSIMSGSGDTLVENARNPAVKLKQGRHQIKLHAPEVFLNRFVTVEIREGETSTIQTPALGKVSIRAVPGNCRLTIDDIPAEAPPITNMDIVIGSHEFVFEWPGGERRELIEEVRPGRPAYVTGQIR